MTTSNRSLLNQSLQIQVTSKYKRNCLIFGALNAVCLSILWFDITQKCPYAFSYWYYCEYAAASVLALSLLYHVLSWLYYRFFVATLVVTEDQRKLLCLDDHDGTFVISPAKTPNPNVILDKTASPMNVSSLSWQSYGDGNPGVSSASWMYNKGSQSFDSPSFNLMNVSTDISFNQSMPGNLSGASYRYGIDYSINFKY